MSTMRVTTPCGSGPRSPHTHLARINIVDFAKQIPHGNHDLPGIHELATRPRAAKPGHARNDSFAGLDVDGVVLQARVQRVDEREGSGLSQCDRGRARAGSPYHEEVIEAQFQPRRQDQTIVCLFVCVYYYLIGWLPQGFKEYCR